MGQSNHPAQYQTDQEWQEALKDRLDQLHTKISDLSNEAISNKSLSDAWHRKYNETKQENAALWAKSKNLDELLDELQAKCKRYEDALKELVRLKDLKDSGQKSLGYDKLKGFAWQAAREALEGRERIDR